MKKIKILALLLVANTTLFAQIDAFLKLDSIKKISNTKKELMGTWVLDTANSNVSNTTRKGTTVKKLKSLDYGRTITEWTLSKKSHVLTAPDKDTVFYSLNEAQDLVYLWRERKQNKAQLIGMFHIEEVSAERLLLVYKEEGDLAKIYLNRKAK